MQANESLNPTYTKVEKMLDTPQSQCWFRREPTDCVKPQIRQKHARNLGVIFKRWSLQKDTNGDEAVARISLPEGVCAGCKLARESTIFMAPQSREESDARRFATERGNRIRNTFARLRIRRP